MSPLMSQYAQLLKSLEERKKSVLEDLKDYEPLQELLKDIEGNIANLKKKMSNATDSGVQKSFFESPHNKPYKGLRITDAAKKYLQNGATDRTMKGIVAALNNGGLDSDYNSIQATINKQKAPNGPFVKRIKEWFIEE